MLIQKLKEILLSKNTYKIHNMLDYKTSNEKIIFSRINEKPITIQFSKNYPIKLQSID